MAAPEGSDDPTIAGASRRGADQPVSAPDAGHGVISADCPTLIGLSVGNAVDPLVDGGADDPQSADDLSFAQDDPAGTEIDQTIFFAMPPDPPAARNRQAPAIEGYEISGELGRGGMGVVYRARQVMLNRPCALKMILAGAYANDEAHARFLAEAEAVARLQHPNVVQIRHIGETDGLPFFELEYLEGGSLDRRLNGTPWPARRAAELMVQVTAGVADAHRLGIVHRDLKPGNILLTADDTPKVSDFGAAKSLLNDTGLTKTDSIMGSPGYMSPEQARGHTKEVGPLADVYALGAILYELLTGRPLFRAATALETLEQVKTAEPVPPSRLVPGLSRDLETIALKCLQKEPVKRYGTASLLIDDLNRFLDGRPILARRISAAELAWRFCRRNPWLAGALGSAALALAAVALLSLADAVEQGRANRKIGELADHLQTSLDKSNRLAGELETSLRE
jgi:hypothetical protein